MDNSKMFLLKRIMGWETNEYSSFGELSGKHVDDIAKLMNEFLRETIKELLPLLNTGEPVQLFDDFAIHLKPNKRKPKSRLNK